MRRNQNRQSYNI